MQSIIASYLFQKKNCCIPLIGKLTISSINANSDFINKTISVTNPKILFEPNLEENNIEFIKYISTKKNVEIDSAKQLLFNFSTQLKNKIKEQKYFDFENLGTFFWNEKDIIDFKENTISNAFNPLVPAIRAVHSIQEQQILVGDLQTTHIQMTQYLAKPTTKKSLWWAWALVLTALAIGAIIYYVNDTNHNTNFGNLVNFLFS